MNSFFNFINFDYAVLLFLGVMTLQLWQVCILLGRIHHVLYSRNPNS